jgi:hypothetical protein
MKNRKWLTYTLGTLLTLIVLAAVAGVSFRIGMTQSASFTHPAFTRRLNGAPQDMPKNFQGNSQNQETQRNFQNNGENQKMQGNFHGNGWMQMRGNPRSQGFNKDFGDRRGGRMSILFPFLFGLIHLVVLGLILWVVYLFVKKSGWKFTRVEAAPAPAETASTKDVGKKKTSN